MGWQLAARQGGGEENSQVGEVVPSQTARLTTARLRMTEVIAAVPEKDDGSASAHVVPVSAPGVRLRRFVPDSPLEGARFEPSVPREGIYVYEGLLFVSADRQRSTAE